MKNIVFLTVSISCCCLICTAQDVFKTTAATIEQLLSKSIEEAIPSTDQHDLDTLRPARTLEELLGRKSNKPPRDTNTVNTQNSIINQNRLFIPNKEKE